MYARERVPYKYLQTEVFYWKTFVLLIMKRTRKFQVVKRFGFINQPVR